ncbi:hypothetical protein KAW18_16440 [candidate division WOR-3 bacterium]|nr:hypothetical protein [candidate division WOR-3 bacterium]
MKTGFIYGYPNKPGKKRYSYHGVDRDCLIQPDPEPFEDFPIGPPLGNWILAWEGSMKTGWFSYHTYYPINFLNSSDEHPCYAPGSGVKCVYYFAEIHLYPYSTGQYMNVNWGDGLNCKYSFIPIGKYKYIYKAWFNFPQYTGAYAWRAFNLGAGSYGKIWKSEDGEFPGYYPVPQGEIIIS